MVMFQPNLRLTNEKTWTLDESLQAMVSSIGYRLNEDLYSRLFAKGVGQQVIKDLPLDVLFALVIAPLLTISRMHIQGTIKLDDSLMMQIIQACWDGIKRYIKR